MNAAAIVITLVLALPVFGQKSRIVKGEEFRSLLNEGFSQHEHADYARALRLLKRAHGIRPHDYFANLLIGIDLIRTGKPEDAVAYLQEAARVRPMEDIPLDYLGEADTRLYHFADAAESYLRAVKVAPTSSQAVEGALDFAIERFRTISADLRGTAKGLAAARRLQAMSYLVDDPRREQLLQGAAQLDPEAPSIWSDLAIAQFCAGKKQEAAESLALALKQNPNDLHARQVAAMLAASRGDWNAAFGDLDLIAERSPGALATGVKDWPQTLQPSSDAAVTRVVKAFLACIRERSQRCALEGLGRSGRPKRVSANVLYQQERWEQLIALPVPKSDTMTWFRHGVALAELGRSTRAIPALERSLKGEGNNVYARFQLARSYAGEAGRVVALLEREDHDEATVHLIRGDVLLIMQANSAAAIGEYTAALRMRGSDPELLARLAEAELENGQLAEAIKNAKAALRINQYQFAAMQTLTRIAIMQRKYRVALPYLSQLEVHDPGDATIQVQLGMVLAQIGDASGAVKHLAPPLTQGYPDEKGSLHALLGHALRKVGRNEEAAQAFARARTLSDEYQRNPHRGGEEQK